MKYRTSFFFTLFVSVYLLFGCDQTVTGEWGDGPDIREPTINRGAKLEDEDLPRLFFYEANNQSLFFPVASPGTIADNLKHESVLGFTYIRFNENLWKPELLNKDDLLIIHLPKDILIQATVLRVQQPFGEITAITAQFKGDHEGTVILSHEGGRTIGEIDLLSENRKFQIRYDSNTGLHYLMEVNPAKLKTLPGAEPVELD